MSGRKRGFSAASRPVAALAALGVSAAALASLAGAGTGAGCSDGGSTAPDGAGGGSSSTGSSSGQGGKPPEPAVVTLNPDAPPLPGETECTVVITTGLPIPDSTHVELCTEIEYATNPPNSGRHWPKWAAFAAYTSPVPREMYVHNLEHGGVVLAYRCDEPCADVVDFLAEVTADVPADPLCVQQGVIDKRMLTTPDPDLDHPVAAAAWGATYTATCLDCDSLLDFIDAQYAKGPEDICPDGISPDGPDGGGLGCD